MRISLSNYGNVSSVDYFNLNFCGTGVKIHPQRTYYYVELDERCSHGVINVTVTAVNHCQVSSEMGKVQYIPVMCCAQTASDPISVIQTRFKKKKKS